VGQEPLVDSSKWMKEVRDKNYMDLLLPGSHDSSTNETLNYIGAISKFVRT
jgi:hypothetical protein